MEDCIFFNSLKRAQRSSDSLGPPWAGCVSASPDFDGSFQSQFSYSVFPAKMFRVFAPPLVSLSFPPPIFSLFCFLYPLQSGVFVYWLACLSSINLENDPLMLWPVVPGLRHGVVSLELRDSLSQCFLRPEAVKSSHSATSLHQSGTTLLPPAPHHSQTHLPPAPARSPGQEPLS